MTDAEYHQYWTGKIFRGEVTTEPVTLPSVGTALDFVSSIKGGISFVDAASVRPGMKVIRIDGHLPGEQGYPLQYLICLLWEAAVAFSDENCSASRYTDILSVKRPQAPEIMVH